MFKTIANSKFILTCAIYLVAISLLSYRYAMLINYSNFYSIKVFSIINIFVVITLFLSFKFFKEFINPISLFCIFIFCYAYSFLPLTPSFVNFSIQTNITIIISIITFITGSILANKKTSFFKFKSSFEIFKFTANKKIFIYVLLFLSLTVFIIESIRFGYVPILCMFSKYVYGDTNSKLIPFLHYFVFISAIIPSWCFILYKDKKISKRELIILSIISIFITLNYLSRQIILLLLLSIFLTYGYYKFISIIKGIIFILVIIFMFLYVGKLRISQDDPQKSTSDYLQQYSQTKYKISSIENWAVIYSSERFYQLNTLINRADSANFKGYGIFTFRPLISFLFLNRIGIIKYPEKFDVIHNPHMSTFAIDPFLDFRFIGCILMNLLYGVIVTLSFLNYKQKKRGSIIGWATCVFCVVMIPFMNFFNTFLIWFIYLLNRFLFK